MCAHVNRLTAYNFSITRFKFKTKIARKYNLTCKINMRDKYLADVFIYKKLPAFGKAKAGERGYILCTAVYLRSSALRTAGVLSTFAII